MPPQVRRRRRRAERCGVERSRPGERDTVDPAMSGFRPPIERGPAAALPRHERAPDLEQRRGVLDSTGSAATARAQTRSGPRPSSLRATQRTSAFLGPAASTAPQERQFRSRSRPGRSGLAQGGRERQARATPRPAEIGQRAGRARTEVQRHQRVGHVDVTASDGSRTVVGAAGSSRTSSSSAARRAGRSRPGHGEGSRRAPALTTRALNVKRSRAAA